MAEDQVLVAVAQRDPTEEEPAPDDFYAVGTEIKILRLLHMPDGSTSILAQGRQRVKVEEIVEEGPFLSAVVTPLPDTPASGAGAEALMRAVLSLFERCVELSPTLSEEVYVAAVNATEPGRLADLIAATIPVDLASRQEVLESRDPVQRLQRVSVMLAKELDVLELESRIHERVHEELDKSQREFFLREQLRIIHRELGETDEQSREVAAFEQKSRVPTYHSARARADQELRRLSTMPSYSPEIGMVRSYLDWLVELPWVAVTEDALDLRRAARVLEENHYGLAKAKDRILEHIAIRKLAGNQRAHRSSAWLARRARARLRWAALWRRHWAANSCASAWVGFATRRKFAAIDALTSGRCRAAFFRRCAQPAQPIRCSCLTKWTSWARMCAVIPRLPCSRCWTPSRTGSSWITTWMCRTI